MISKVLGIALLVSYTQALQYDDHQGATSAVSFNEHHNTIHHIQSAPTLVKAIAPIHAAPLAVKVAAPVYAAPQSQGSPFSSLSLGHNGAPVARYTSPFASSLSLPQHVNPSFHYAAPIATVGASPFGSSHSLAQHANPSLHYAAPIARVAAPVLLKAAAPAQHGNSYTSLSIGHSAPVASHLVPASPVAKFLTPAVHAAPAVHVAPAIHASAHHDEYAHPKYEFAYGVEDHHTGDIHSHKEVRDGDVTQGEYSLHEADGTVRIVKYTVDKHSGFNAIVERSGHATHAQPAPVAKAVVAAPVLTKAVVAAPTYHH